MPPAKTTPLDQFDFHHRIALIQGTAVVIFTAPGCRACTAWKQLLQLPSATPANTKIFEVDAEQNLALVRELEVFHLPTLLLFQDGDFHGEIQCEARVDSIQSQIQQLLRQAPQELP